MDGRRTMTAPWVEHALWWHVYPLGATGADTTGADRARGAGLAALIPWLDRVAELGLNGIALGPVFASETHGYDTVDHRRVDERLGTDADLDRLFAEARSRGIRVSLDGVFNHVGRGHPLVRRALADEGAPEREWFRWGSDGRPEVFEGHDALVALNHGSPAVREEVASVMRHWLDRGADAWRLDAAYAVPTGFWADVLPRVRAAHPDAYLYGEVLHGDYAAFVAESGLDSVTQYELWKAIWSALDSRNLFELDWTLQRHARLLETFVPYTFVGNHDVTRIASRIDDERHREHAVVLLMTLGGTPAVYYGDETGATGVKEERAGGDDAVRPALPGSVPAGSTGPVEDAYRTLIGLRRRHPWLHRAVSTTGALTNTTLVYDVAADGRRLSVALNLGDDALHAVADGTPLAGRADRVDAGWSIPPHGWVVLGD